MHQKSHIPNYIFFIGLLLQFLLLFIAFDMHRYKGYGVVVVNGKSMLLHGKDTLDRFSEYSEMTIVPGNRYLIAGRQPEGSGQEYGIIDINKNVVSEFKKGNIYAITDYNTRAFTGLFSRKLGTNHYELFSSDKKITPDTFRNIATMGSDNRILIRSHDQKVGFIDYSGKIMINPDFYFFENENIALKYCHFSDYLCSVMDADGKYGFIDTSGKKVIDFKYDLALPFSSSLAEVYSNGKASFINNQGKEIIKTKQP